MLIAETAKASGVPGSKDPPRAGLTDLELETKIRTEERGRIARELHDSTSQLIVAIQVQLMRLRQSSCVTKTDVFDSVMAELHDVIAELHDGVRRVSRCDTVDVGSLGEALKGMAREFERRTGLGVETAIDRMADALPPKVAGALFRVSQEALANACRHAKPTHIRLSVTGNSESVTLRVVDDGIGFPAPRRNSGAGHGLANMRERVGELGGRFTIRNLKRGAVVQAKINLSHEPPVLFSGSSTSKTGTIAAL